MNTIDIDSDYKIKTPSLAWRRVGSIFFDITLLSLLHSLCELKYGLGFLVESLSFTIFSSIWIFLMWTKKSSPGMFFLDLIFDYPSENFKKLIFIRYCLVWAILFIHQSVVFLSGKNIEIIDRTTLDYITFFYLFWFIMNLGKIISSQGEKTIVDLLIGSKTSLKNKKFLSAMRKCLFTTFFIGTICFTFFSEQLLSSNTEFANISSSMSFINSKEYTGSEILDLYNPLVFEITTNYQTQGGFLWLQKRWSSMQGTGLLFSNNKNNALIITNSHVVVPENLEGEYQCTIKRNSQEDACNVSLVAIGKDDLDLALLKVATDGTWEDFEVPFETSGNLNQGDPCFAIGNAQGEGLSITNGIISKIEDFFIRTSTPISSGNSGGPLILSEGAVFAGIITAQDAREDSQNMNYAIPVDYLLNQENWIFLEETLEDLDETKLLLGKMLR